MNLILKLILKLLSRPVVCANFQGVEANIVFQIAESVKATVDLLASTRRRVKITTHMLNLVLNLVLEYY
jgi:hypothetical protein